MEDYDGIIFLVSIIAVIIGAVILIRYLISISAKYKDDNKKDERVEIIDEFEKRVLEVTVVDMQCAAVVKGTKNPKAASEYIVFFKTQDGRIIERHVDEEMYFCFDIGMQGRLTLSDNVIYSFEAYN